MRRIWTSAEWPYEMAMNLFHILESKYNKHLLGRNREPNLVVGQPPVVSRVILQVMR